MNRLKLSRLLVACGVAAMLGACDRQPTAAVPLVVTITSPSLTLSVDDSTRLEARVAEGPDGAEVSAEIRWSSSDTTVARIDATGTIIPCPSDRPRGNHRFARIDAGGSHTCGVTVDSQLLCWGSDAVGLLGDGPGSPNESCTCSFSPVAVEIRSRQAG